MDINKLITKIARDSILEKLSEDDIVDRQSILYDFSILNEIRASFVTLLKPDAFQIKQLRACIGTLYPHRSLLEDIVHNAKSAAFSDPRFEPVSLDELEQISIEVSVLSEPMNISYKNIEDLKAKIIPTKHGVIIKKGFNRAVFLPDVWDKLPDFHQFFEHLCRKAGLNTNCLNSLDQVEIFEVTKYSEVE
jgi:AmmeMemoRadiSam system protein A